MPFPAPPRRGRSGSGTRLEGANKRTRLGPRAVAEVLDWLLRCAVSWRGGKGAKCDAAGRLLRAGEWLWAGRPRFAFTFVFTSAASRWAAAAATGSSCSGGMVGAGQLERSELGAGPFRFGLLIGLAAGPVRAPELPPCKGQAVSPCFQDLRYLPRCYQLICIM